MATVQYLATGGVALWNSPTASQLQYVKGLGFRHLNFAIAEASIRFNPNNTLTIPYSAIESQLSIVQNYGFRSHIKIGQMMPLGLLPNDATVLPPLTLAEFPETNYRLYIGLLLTHLTQTLGCTDFRMEVGNEMDFGKSWLTDEVGHDNPIVYTGYLYLYTLWAEEVATFLAANPTVTIDLGGYAGAADYWLEQFAIDTDAMKRDYISFHYYGFGFGRAPLQDQLDAASTYAPIILTEWGYDPFYGSANFYTNNQSIEIYGWTKRFFQNCSKRWHISDAMFIGLREDGLGLFWLNGNTGPYGTAVFELANCSL